MGYKAKLKRARRTARWLASNVHKMGQGRPAEVWNGPHQIAPPSALVRREFRKALKARGLRMNVTEPRQQEAS